MIQIAVWCVCYSAYKDLKESSEMLQRSGPWTAPPPQLLCQWAQRKASVSEATPSSASHKKDLCSSVVIKAQQLRHMPHSFQLYLISGFALKGQRSCCFVSSSLSGWHSTRSTDSCFASISHLMNVIWIKADAHVSAFFYRSEDSCSRKNTEKKNFSQYAASISFELCRQV